MNYIDNSEFDKINVFGKRAPNNAFSQYFIGESFLNPLTNSKEYHLFLSNVTFKPCCRYN